MAYDSFGIIVSRAPAATPTTFTPIADLDVVSLPSTSIAEADASVQNHTIDQYVFSTLIRRKPVPLTLNFLPYEGTQDNVTGLYRAHFSGSIDGYRFAHAASSLIYVASGAVTAIDPKSPFEGKLALDVTFRFTGQMTLNGVTVGT